jgi:hypothetical protein
MYGLGPILEITYYADWIHLARNRIKWLALVNTTMNLPVPLIVGNLLTS